jgi:DNA-binding PadR family transcriptional regulator
MTENGREEHIGSPIDSKLLKTGDVSEIDRDSIHSREYTKFQLDILAPIASESKHGLGIKADVEEFYGTDVNHGRLYPNLDTLVADGLITKRQADRRTNSYTLTEAGAHALVEQMQWWLSFFDDLVLVDSEAYRDVIDRLEALEDHRLSGALPATDGGADE